MAYLSYRSPSRKQRKSRLLLCGLCQFARLSTSNLLYQDRAGNISGAVISLLGERLHKPEENLKGRKTPLSKRKKRLARTVVRHK
jgi:hypothetical protein